MGGGTFFNEKTLKNRCTFEAVMENCTIKRLYLSSVCQGSVCIYSTEHKMEWKVLHTVNIKLIIYKLQLRHESYCSPGSFFLELF